MGVECMDNEGQRGSPVAKTWAILRSLLCSRLCLNHVEVGGEEALHCARDHCVLTAPSFEPALRHAAEEPISSEGESSARGTTAVHSH